MPEKQIVSIEATQVLQAYVTDENGKERAAAKMKINHDGRIQIWLAGRDPVTIAESDLSPLTALLGSACSLLPSSEFDPSDPDPSDGEKANPEESTKLASPEELTIETDVSTDEEFEIEVGDEF